MSRAEPVRVVLAGCGRFGAVLAHAITSIDDIEVRFTVDADPNRAREVAAIVGAEVAADYHDALRCEEIDGVILATTHVSHGPLAIAAAANGKHIFCEKPMAVTTDQCRDMIKAASDAHVALVVGHLYRLMPLVERAKSLIESGDMGAPLAVSTARSHRVERLGWWAKRESYGGLLHSPGIHNLDLMNHFLGIPERVYAQSPAVIQPQVDYPDTAFVTVSYQASRIGQLFASISDPLDPPKGIDTLRVIAERGALAIDFAPPGRLAYSISGVETVETGADGDRRQAGADHAVRAELQNFADAARGRARPFIAPADASAAVALCEAAYRSAESGAPVGLGRAGGGDTSHWTLTGSPALESARS